MAQAFKRLGSRNISTSATTIGNYTVGSILASTVIGLSISNTSSVAGTVDIFIQNGASVVAYLVKGAPLPVAGTLVAVGGDQKVVLQPGDLVGVVVNGGATGDALMSVLELS